MLGQATSRLDKLGIIEGYQRLKGGIGAFTADNTGLAVGGVEHLHARRGSAALPEGVKATTVKVFTAVATVGVGVTFTHGYRFPNPFGLVGFDAGPANLLHEEPAS